MWWLLLMVMASAQENTLEQRLLGPQAPIVGPAAPIVGPVAPVVQAALPNALVEAQPAAQPSPLSFMDTLETDGTVSAASSAPGLPWWVPLVALAGAGAFYWTRRKTAVEEGELAPAIRVISRAGLGGSAGISMVDVLDGDRCRRLVIGTGDKQPVLLTELAPSARLEPVQDDRPVSGRASVLARALSRPKASSSPKSAPRTPRPANDWMAADPSSEIGPRKAAARVLIHQEMNRRNNA
jgi:hypothetical protein